MMGQYLRAMTLFLALAMPITAQVKGPTEITIPVGRLAVVPLIVEGDAADYVVVGKDVDALREYDPDAKKLRLRVIGYSTGQAWVVIATTFEGKLKPLHVITVTIGAGPKPPTPPEPTPPEPTPPKPDALTKKLQEAFDKDTSDKVKKSEWLKALAGFYAAMSDHVQKPEVKTLGELLADYRAAIPALLPDGAVVDLRRVCGEEVAGVIGVDSSPERELVAVFRQQLADGFKRLSKALDGVK